MRLISACLFLMLCYSARSDTSLTFDDCVKEASANNKDILASESSIESLQDQIKGAYSGFYPQLSALFNLNYGESYTASTSPSIVITNAGATASIAPSLSLSQNIFSGFADVAKVELARANLESAKADLAATKAKVSATLKTAFAGLVYAQDATKLAKQIKERRTANYKLVNLLFQSGRENFGSVALAKAYLEQADFQIFQANNGLRSASVALASVLGRDFASDLRVTGQVPLSDINPSPDFNALVLDVPDYIKAVAQEKVAAAQKISAFSPFYPSVGLNSSAGITGSSSTSNTQWFVGLSINYPFFSGGKDYYATKSAVQGITTARLNKLAIQKNSLATLVASHRAYIETKEQLRVDKLFSDALSKQEKIATADYNNGFLTFQNWDQIETSYINRLFTLLTDAQNLVSAEAAWQQSLGVGVIP